MGLALDIIIILIMLTFIIIGYKKGLIKVAVSFLSVIIAILITIILYKPVSNMVISKTNIDEKISDAIYSKIENIDFQNITEEEKNNNGILAIAEEQINSAIENSVTDIARTISNNLSLTIVEGICFIGLIILIRLGLLILNIFADFIGNLPIIKQFNKSGGIIYGVVEGFFIINLLLAIAFMLNPIFNDGKIEKCIKQSTLGQTIYENNFITNSILK